MRFERCLKHLAVLLTAAFVAGLCLLPGAAEADLKPYSVHSLTRGKQPRPALPLPEVRQAPLMSRDDSGRVTVTTRFAYVAANWQAKRGVRRDRVQVTLSLARRLMKSGPDPSAPVYRR